MSSLSTKKVLLLTGDIGGTNSRMSLYATDQADALVVKTFRNYQYLQGKEDQDDAFAKYIVGPFLEHCWNECQQQLPTDLSQVEVVACIATAGVVSQNKAHLTNLNNLLIDGNIIAQGHPQATSKRIAHPYLQRVVQCQIINDFVAQGYGCLTLDLSESSKEVVHLYGPKLCQESTANHGPKVCVGAGTGLGECYLTPSHDDQDTYTCFPSEGGHVEFAPRTPLQVQLWQYLVQKFAPKGQQHRISVERVVSGTGLANVYEFLATTFPKQVDPQIHAKFVQAPSDQRGQIVGETAHKQDGQCRQALQIMMNAYGSEVSSAAIKWIPIGGLFVTGGLTPKNITYMTGPKSQFLQAYKDKGRVSSILERVPLYAVLVEDLGVRGARYAAETVYQNYAQHGGGHGSRRRDTDVWWKTHGGWCLIAAAIGFTMGACLHKRP